VHCRNDSGKRIAGNGESCCHGARVERIWDVRPRVCHERIVTRRLRHLGQRSAGDDPRTAPSDAYTVTSASAQALAGVLIYRVEGDPSRECTFRYTLTFSGARYRSQAMRVHLDRPGEMHRDDDQPR